MEHSRVLLTYGWCRTAYVAAECLAAAGYEVYACDKSHIAMLRFSRHVKEYFIVPNRSANPEDYARAVANIAENRQIGTVVPVHEDMTVLLRFRHHFHPHTQIVCPELGQLARVLDKAVFHDTAQKAGLCPPRTFVPATVESAQTLLHEQSFPLVIKIRNGNSAKGVRFISSRDDGKRILTDLIDRYGLDTDNLPLIQEYVDGDQCGIAFLAKDGEILGSFCERYLRFKENRIGTSVLRKAFKSKALLREAEKLCKYLKWTGVGQLDFIIDKSGKPRVLEMNPRFWGALRLAVVCGQNFPVGLLRLSRGESTENCFSSEYIEKQCLWVVGQMISTVGLLRGGKIRRACAELLESLREVGSLDFDDLRFTDPLPFLAEALYYAIGFVKSGGALSPEGGVL